MSDELAVDPVDSINTVSVKSKKLVRFISATFCRSMVARFGILTGILSVNLPASILGHATFRLIFQLILCYILVSSLANLMLYSGQ